MRSIIVVFSICLLVSSCQESKKIAFIDRTDVINNYQAKLDIEERFKLKNENFIKRRDSLGRAFQIEAQDFQLKLNTLSDKKAQELYQQLDQKQKLLQQQFQVEQQELQNAFNTEIDSTIARVKRFVEKYGNENGYDYIFGTSDATSTIMYGPEEENISKDVLEALNAAYGSKE
ncbi:MAG: OmpH family outer membrane protein [Winogradskyella sp.]|nr:OmpH family outer membrane protein [Winogradskyella sp.]